ncbi:uncharacterized protein [Medicago truncatula]|nr:uncharacterized protein LOC11438060 isoform X3 [Medicago truncatula]XP_039687279.1 uncharacterized protein LOC11438060 isoform X3 [Medicago truncatula]
MASFLTDLAKTYVEKLINGVIAESSYICCFTCIANDFEEERSRLETENTTVKQRVDVATSRGEVIQANALFWEKEADELIQEDTKTKQKCLFGFCPHIIWRYKKGKELTNKKEQIKRLIENGKDLVIGLPAPLPDVERYSSRDYISFESRKSKYKELFDALKDDNSYITGLQGMGGTGKTTLAKKVGKELKQCKQFTNVIDTTVSLSPDIRKIQDDIAGPLGLKFDDCSESDRPKKLWSRLTNEGKIDQNEEKKILLIFDDVWDDIDFDKIGIPDNHKDCRILVTTRSLSVCHRLGCNKKIQLEVLSDEEAWTMFQTHAGLKEMSPTSLLDKGRKIANECKGLPVAIAVIASSLKGIQNPKVWDGALKSLQKPMPGDEEVVKIYKCLDVSYDNMKNENAMRLFLLCSVFREDEKISIERLTRLGIGGGLFGDDFDSYDDARNQVVISTTKLVEFSLLLEADRDQSILIMHDLVRDAAQWTSREFQRVKLYHKYQKASVEKKMNIKYLLCEGKPKDVFSFKLDGSKLEILIVIMHKDEDCQNVKIEVPNSFFENITGLRVFHLIYDQYPTIPLSLPHSVQSMKNIRSLLFERVNLGDISILGNLQSLETLDLDDCKIDELPHGIAKLEKFRLLKLESCEIARNNPFEVIEGCSSLEELYFTDSFNDCCKEITFPKLRRFNIDEYSSSEDESSSKCVSIVFEDKFFLTETTLKYCMQEAEVLRLRRIEGEWKNIIPEIVPMDQGMNDIVELRLGSISQLQCLIDTKHTESQVSKVFSKLVVLKLWNQHNLEELFNGPLSFDSLNFLEKLSIQDCKHLKSLFKCKLNLFNLKRLSLKGCPMLISLFQLSTVVSLVLLERLKIKDCEGLENIIIGERKGKESRGEIINDNESTSQGSIFQKLEVLSIEKCPALEFVLPFLYAHDFPALESITIESCDNLKYIFGKDVQLGSLKTMELHDIPNFIDIFPKCNRTMTSSIKRSSSISGDASKPQEQSEPIKCNMFSWTDIYCCGKIYGHRLRSTTLVSKDQPQDNLMKSTFPPLKELELNNCGDGKIIKELSGNVDNFLALERLMVTNNSKVESIFCLNEINEQQMNLALEDIDLDVLPMMTCLFVGPNNSFSLQNLTRIKIKGCEKLKIVFTTSVIRCLPQLYYMRIEECNELKHIIEDDLENTTKTCFPNLKRIVVIKCNKLKYVFSISIYKDLPALYHMRIEECNELRHIIEDDLENKKSSNFMSTTKTCFPKLRILVVEKCNKLKYVFPISISKELPELKVLIIREADELEEIFVSEFDDHKVEIPNLKLVIFENLPSLYHAQGIQFQVVKHRFILNCQKLSLASESTPDFENDISASDFGYDFELFDYWKTLFQQLQRETKGHDSGNENPSPQTTKDFVVGIEVQTASEHKLTSPQIKMKETPQTENELIENAPDLEIPTNLKELMNERSMDQQRSLGETDTAVKPSQGIEISAEEGTTSANAKTITTSLGPLSTSKHKTSSQEYGGGEMAISSPISITRPLTTQEVHVNNLQETSNTNDDQVSLNEDAVVKVTSIVEEQFSKDVEFEVLESKPALIIPSPQAFQSPSMLSGGDPSQLDEELEDLEPRGLHILRIEEMEQTLETKHEFVENVPQQEMPSVAIIPTNSKELMNEQEMEQKRLRGEIDATVKPSQENNVSEISVEEGTTSANAKTKTSSQEEGDNQRAIAYTPIDITKPVTTQDVDVEIWQETSNTNDDQVSLNDDNVMKASSNTEDQFSKDDNILVSKSRPSSIASQFPSKPSEGDPSQIDEDLSSSFVVTGELENLVSNNHLAIEKLSLLTDFLVKHPSVLLRDTSLSSRYKGYAYNSLAELLKFLQTHSVLDVLGSSNSEFVELLQDVRRFPFDKEWLDDVEMRALFPDLQFSQNALQKLLDSEQRVTKEVEEMRLKINIFNQHLEDLKHQLTSSEADLETIIQQKAKILETKAALSAPLGY